MRVVFGECEFDSGRRVLIRHGLAMPLGPKAFQLLELLLDRRPEAVAKKELVDQLWPETFVSDASLHNVMAEVRAAVGDTPRMARFIRHVLRYGYAFHGDARLASADTNSCPGPSGARLVLGSREWLQKARTWSAAIATVSFASIPPPSRDSTSGSSSRTTRPRRRIWGARMERW